MILPESYAAVMFLMVLSLLCLGSWAAAFKLYAKWRFELFYLDFAIGLLVASMIYSLTVGNLGYDGFTLLDDLQHAGKRQWLYVFGAGVIFNVGNMLLIAAVSLAGLAVAFPMGSGIALLVGTGIGLAARPAWNLPLTGLGCLLIGIAVVFSALCYRIMAGTRLEALARSGRSKNTRKPNPVKGIVLALLAGGFLGSFTPLLDNARQGELGLGPYALGALFALGVFFSTLVLDVFFMNLPLEGEPIEVTRYLRYSLGQHLVGVGSGAVWLTGILAALVYSGTPDVAQASPFLRILLGQGAPVLAALWGILAFREFKECDYRVKMMGFLTPVLFLCGIAMLGLAPMLVRKD
jgi:glucose uptake protein